MTDRVQLSRGVRYGLVLDVAGPLVPSTQIATALSDTGFSQVSVLEAGSAPAEVEIVRYVATFPRHIAYAEGTWSDPSTDIRPDVDAAFTIRDVTPRPPLAAEDTLRGVASVRPRPTRRGLALVVGVTSVVAGVLAWMMTGAR